MDGTERKNFPESSDDHLVDFGFVEDAMLSVPDAKVTIAGDSAMLCLVPTSYVLCPHNNSKPIMHIDLDTEKVTLGESIDLASVVDLPRHYLLMIQEIVAEALRRK